MTRSCNLGSLVLLVVLFVTAGCAPAPAPTAAPPTLTPAPPPPTPVPPTAPAAPPTAVPIPSPTRGPVQFAGKIVGEPEKFDTPSGLGLDKQGNLFVFDSRAPQVFKYGPDGKRIAQWGSRGTSDGQFARPVHELGSLAVDGQGNVYVADAGNARIQKFDNNGKFLLTWGTKGTGDGQFTDPLGMAVDAQGFVYVIDDQDERIQKFDGNGKFVSKFGGPGRGNGEFLDPGLIAVDNQGNIYVADYGNARVQKFDREGKFMATWDKCGETPIYEPAGVAVDAQGNVYVTEFSARSLYHTQPGNRVCKFDREGRFLLAWGGSGVGDGQFSKAAAIAIDAQGNVYVSELGGIEHRIQKFSQEVFK